ncbi:MAG TPA: hypothetical protein ENH87_09490, partial [Pricia antarctica]|nr:hypothetical protein [Pricia antarctica]
MTTRRKFLGSIIAGGLGGIVTSGHSAPPLSRNLNPPKGKFSMQEALDLHSECLIFDGHTDTPVERVARKENVDGMMSLNRKYHMDLPRMKEVGYDAGAFIVGNGVVANVWTTMEQTLHMIEANPDDLLLVRSSKDVLRARDTGKVGILLAIEGIAKWIHGEPDILRMLYRNGVKWIGLTHGEGGLPSESKNKNEDILYLQGSPSPRKYCTPEERKIEGQTAKGLT